MTALAQVQRGQALTGAGTGRAGGLGLVLLGRGALLDDLLNHGLGLGGLLRRGLLDGGCLGLGGLGLRCLGDGLGGVGLGLGGLTHWKIVSSDLTAEDYSALRADYAALP